MPKELGARNSIYPAAGALMALVILVLSVMPAAEGGINSGVWAHLGAYGVLSVLLALAVKARGGRHVFVAALLLSGGYGALIECIQFFLPYRQYDVLDMIVNFCASAAGSGAVCVLRIKTGTAEKAKTVGSRWDAPHKKD